MLASAKGEDVSLILLEVFDGAAVGVVVVGVNYPTNKTPAQPLPVHLDIPQTYHAATRLEGEGDKVQVIADGGRIAVVSARRKTIAEACAVVYELINRGHLGHLAVREDIAAGY